MLNDSITSMLSFLNVIMRCGCVGDSPCSGWCQRKYLGMKCHDVYWLSKSKQATKPNPPYIVNVAK